VSIPQPTQPLASALFAFGLQCLLEKLRRRLLHLLEVLPEERHDLLLPEHFRVRDQRAIVGNLVVLVLRPHVTDHAVTDDQRAGFTYDPLCLRHESGNGITMPLFRATAKQSKGMIQILKLLLGLTDIVLDQAVERGITGLVSQLFHIL
jgi:hypothetical protein